VVSTFSIYLIVLNGIYLSIISVTRCFKYFSLICVDNGDFTIVILITSFGFRSLHDGLLLVSRSIWLD